MAITQRAVGSWAVSNATTQTVTLPTHAAGDMLIVRTIRKPFTSPDATVINTAGWRPVGIGVANGATANGAGAGSMGFKAFYKLATSAAETNPVVTWGTTSAPGACVAASYQKDGSETWIIPVGTGGGDATARTSQTSTMASHISVITGDVVDFFRGQCDDSGALTVPTITQTGVTYDAVTESPAAALLDGTSNDIAADGGYRTATAGPSSAAAVITGTSAASEEHGAWMTRLRVVTVSGYPAEVLADLPSGYWRMGEASGSVLDSAGSNHGTTSGTVTRDVAGALTVADEDGAITFGGGHVIVPDHASLDLGDVVTAEAWINAATSGAHKGIVGKDADAYYLRLDADNGLTLLKKDALELCHSTIKVPGTGWHHVAATKSGATIKLYIDGADVTGTITNATLVDNNLAVHIGSADVGFNEPMAGSIDEVAVYNTALSAARILAHFNAGTAAQTVTPTTAVLTATKFAPTVTITDNQLVTPPTASLTLTKFAPVLKETTTPTTVSLTTAKFAPTITASDNQLVTPTTKSVALSTFAPTIALSANQLVTPSTASLVLTAFAPVLKETTTPTTATLSTACFAPTVTASDHQTVTPTTKALTLTTFAPTVTATTGSNITATPDTKALTLATFVPTVSLSDHQTVTPTPKALTTATFAPIIKETTTPTTAALVTAKFAPTVTATSHQTATPITRALTLSTFAPSVIVNETLVPTTKAFTLSTFVPTVTATTNTRVELEPATGLVLTGYAPTIDLSAFKLVIPPTLGLVLMTYPPTAEQHSITPLPRIVSGTVVIARGPGATVTPIPRGSTTVVAIRRPSARVRR